MLSTALTVLLAIALGVFTWSFLEYVIHRFLGHSKKPRTEFGKEHQAHHRLAHYFAPTSKKILFTAPVFLVTGLAASLLVGPLLGIAWTVGFAGFYTTYEIIHRRIHTHAPRNAYARFLRRHHYHHHFRSASVNHGVTTPIWDLVFGTFTRPDVIPVPEKKVMAWLIDPATSDIRAEYQGDYKLLRQRRHAANPSHADSAQVEAAA